MRDYGVISPMFWIGETGRALRKNPNAQRVAIYLMTAPASEMTGVYYCPLASILNDVGTFEAPSKPRQSPFGGASTGLDSPLEAVRQALLTLIELDFCFYDFDSEFVFVKEMARWQIGESLKESDNRVVGLRKYVKSMPKSIAARFIGRYNDDFHLGFSMEECTPLSDHAEAPWKPLERGSIEPLRSQEQKQEQEQEQDNTNKQLTNIGDTRARGESDVGFVDFDSLSSEIEHMELEQLEKVVDDMNAVMSPVQVITLARMHGIKVYRSDKLNNICERNVLTVDNVRRCIELTKQSQKGGPYLIGILGNAVNEPDNYHTAVYERAERAARKAGVDENLPF